MAAWLDAIVSEERLLHCGHAACAGCGPAINVRHVLDGLKAARPDDEIVLVVPASCWTIIAGVYPANAFGVSVHLAPFAAAAAEAAGIKAALHLRGDQRTQVVVWGGDGSTLDIGFSGVSAAAERDEDLVYVLNDNEAYMNTGVQQSGATPEGAWTTTSPQGARQAKKEVGRLLADHGIPYAATLAAGSLPQLKDLRAKVARAAEVEGFRFLHVLGGCPPGWRYPTAQTVELVRLAVDSHYFPLWECDHGRWRLTYRPKRPVPLADFLSAQGRFAAVTTEVVARLQAEVDARWARLEASEEIESPTSSGQLAERP